jgi:hypothetical protein
LRSVRFETLQTGSFAAEHGHDRFSTPVSPALVSADRYVMGLGYLKLISDKRLSDSYPIGNNSLQTLCRLCLHKSVIIATDGKGRSCF